MNINRTKALFKKAYNYNWDTGIATLKKIINDKDCDKATAIMIFWHGSPDFFYNKNTVESLQEYEIPNYELLKEIEQKVLDNKFESIISYEIEEMFLLKQLGNISIELTRPVVGKFKYKDILWPNNNPFQEEIFEICKNCKSTDDIYALEEKGADFNKKILDGYSTPIEVAVNYGQIEALKYFFEKKFDFNKKFNKNPLLFNAISNKHIDTVKFLVDNGADVNKKGEFGRTAMHHIAGLGDYNGGFDSKLKKIADYLISKEADLDIGDVDKKKPLDLARMWGNEKYIQFIQNSESK